MTRQCPVARDYWRGVINPFFALNQKIAANSSKARPAINPRGLVHPT